MQNRGMTLIELILVIAILGIITSICLPKNNIRDYKLHSQAKLLTNEIRVIRHKVMTEGGFHGIILQENYYMITNGITHSKIVELGEDIYLGDNLGKQVKFNPDGSPRNAGSIIIQDKKTMKYYDITIVPYTGRILLKKE